MSSLSGKRVLITRPRAQATGLIEKLTRLEAIPVVFPTIEISTPEEQGPLDEAIRHLPEYAWVIFTSVNGVSAFWQRLTGLGKDSSVLSATQVAAIGPATAQALRDHGVEPAYVPAEHIAEAILPGLGSVAGQRILLPRADIARKALVEELKKQGASPEEIAVYRTVPAQPDPQALKELEKGIDIATFTSSSTVRNFFALLGERAGALLQGALIACIGPITAEEALKHGLSVDLVASEYTVDGLVDALLKWPGENNRNETGKDHS